MNSRNDHKYQPKTQQCIVFALLRVRVICNFLIEILLVPLGSVDTDLQPINFHCKVSIILN